MLFYVPPPIDILFIGKHLNVHTKGEFLSKHYTLIGIEVVFIRDLRNLSDTRHCFDIWMVSCVCVYYMLAAPNDFAGSSSLMLCWATINDPTSPDNGSATVWHTQRPPGPALPQEQPYIYIYKQKRNSEIKGEKIC